MPSCRPRLAFRPRCALPLLVLLAPLAACAPAADRTTDRLDSGAVAAETGDVGSAAGRSGTSSSTCVANGATLTSTGVGSVRLGETRAALRSRCGGRDTAFTLGEGMTETGVVLPAPGARLVAVTTGGDRVRGILIAPGEADASGVGGAANFAPATSGGLRIGSTMAEVRATAPNACPLVGEGVIVVALVRPAGVSLKTSAALSLVRGGRAPALTALPDTARVLAIWITGAGPACG